MQGYMGNITILFSHCIKYRISFYQICIFDDNFFLKGLPKPFKQIPNPFKRLFNRKRQTVRNVFAWHIMPRDRQNIFIMFISSSLTFVVFNILQINCCHKFWGFFLCYSLTHLESPLEIFPYGAPPFPPGKSYPFHGGGMDIFRNHILHL